MEFSTTWLMILLQKKINIQLIYFPGKFWNSGESNSCPGSLVKGTKFQSTGMYEYLIFQLDYSIDYLCKKLVLQYLWRSFNMVIPLFICLWNIKTSSIFKMVFLSYTSSISILFFCLRHLISCRQWFSPSSFVQLKSVYSSIIKTCWFNYVFNIY